MKNNQIESLLVNVSQIITLMKGVNINKEAILTHSATLKQIRTKLDKWQTLYQNEEERKKLSPIEQKTLMNNAQNFWATHEEIRKELDYLDMTKQPLFLSNALNELTYAFLLIEWLSDFVGKSGRTILPHLTALRANSFNDGKYKNQIDSLYAEIEAISHDFYVGHVQVINLTIYPEYPMLIPICNHLTLAGCFLQKEKERLLTEVLPELKIIKIPEEVFPQVPDVPKTDIKDLKN
jgi:hypothetical protein